MKCLKNNRGDTIVLAVAVTIFLMVVFYCMNEMFSAIAVIGNVRDTTKIVFDKYTNTKGKEYVASIKSGTDYILSIDKEELTKLLQQDLGIPPTLIAKTDGIVRFTISDINTTYIVDRSLKTSLTYNLTMPLYFFRKEILTLKKQVLVECRFNLK